MRHTDDAKQKPHLKSRRGFKNGEERRFSPFSEVAILHSSFQQALVSLKWLICKHDVQAKRVSKKKEKKRPSAKQKCTTLSFSLPTQQSPHTRTYYLGTKAVWCTFIQISTRRFAKMTYFCTYTQPRPRDDQPMVSNITMAANVAMNAITLQNHV